LNLTHQDDRYPFIQGKNIMTQHRKNYSQRYPIRAKIQNTIAAIALVSLLFPYLPKVSVNIEPAMADEGIQRGSGRAE
jgi:hypothetical protein